MISFLKKIIIIVIFFIYQLTFGQIRGIIQWNEGGFAEGIEVGIKNKNLFTKTDNRGFFSFSESEIGDTLVVNNSYLKEIKEIIVQKTDTLIKITLKKLSPIIPMDTVIVIGSIRVKYTGSYITIRGDELASMPQASINEMLNGILGINFSGSGGQPGAATNIAIRGVNSFTGSFNPLYVIDGISLGKGLDSSDLLGNYSSFSPLSNLDPNSIESITILKDVAGTSIYGAAGANGVILIETKNGKYNKEIKFNFTSEIGFQDVAFDKHKWMTSEQYMDWGALVYAGTDHARGETNAFSNLASYRAQFVENMKNNGWDGTTSTDWTKEIQRNRSIISQYSFNVSGGNERISFYLGASYYKNEPLVRNSKFNRTSVDLGLNYKITEKLEFKFKGSVGSLQTNTYTQGSAYSSPWSTGWLTLPIYPVYNKDGTFNIENLGGSQWYNPVELLNSDFLKGNITTWRGSMRADYKINKEFNFVSDFGIQYQNLVEKSWWNQNSGNGRSRNGLFQQNEDKITDYSWTNFVNYKKDILGTHHLNIDFGMEYQEHKRNYQSISKYNYPPYTKPSLSNGTNSLTLSGGEATWKQISYIGRFNYIIDKKYIITGGFRRDGNSTFGTNNKWGNFWNTGFMWNIKEENFLSYDSTMNDLKFRINYGTVGNTPMTEWGKLFYYKTLLKGESYDSGESVLYFSSAGNDNLKWEQSKQLGIGLDFGLFDNKISGSLDYYNKKTKDLISVVPLSYTVGGVNSYYANVGSLRNRGLELTVKSKLIDKGEFIWNIVASGSYNKSKILKLNTENSNGVNLIGYSKALKVGKQAGEYYTWTWAGVDSNTGYGTWYVNNSDLENRYKAGKLTTSEQAAVNEGELYYNSKGKLVTTDKSFAQEEFQGSTAFPIWQMSLYNQFFYKGFSLSILFTGSFDYKVMDAYTSYWMSDGETVGNRNQDSDLLNSWTPDNPNADNPLQIGTQTATNTMSSRFLRRGDHIRLKEIKLFYSFPREIVEDLGVEGLTLYIRGVNLFTWAFDKKLKSDPDSYSVSARNKGYPDFYGKGYYDFTSPVMKILSFGVSVNF